MSLEPSPSGDNSHPGDDLIDAYDYTLPEHLIAAEPATEREAARLLHLDRSRGTVAHETIATLPELLRPCDLLVLNDTKVIPARLRGVRERTGGRWEGLYLRNFGEAWELLGQTRGRLTPGETVLLTHDERPDQPPLRLTLREKSDEGIWRAVPESDSSTLELLETYGAVPLPPYIRKGVEGREDVSRYQTVYARHPGSVAAPTAGLHLTEALLQRCRQRGIDTTAVTLHVGIGTFRPVTVQRLAEHVMHSEWAELSPVTAQHLADCRAAGGRIIAVGTTSVRVLESAAATGEIAPFQGETNLFLRPPYRFRAVDALLTNFHLPRSTLLMLVSAFAGREFIQRAYQTAIDQQYRFYSYGDAMLVE